MRLQKVSMQTGDIISLKAFYQQLPGLNIHYEDKRSFELIPALQQYVLKALKMQTTLITILHGTSPKINTLFYYQQ